MCAALRSRAAGNTLPNSTLDTSTLEGAASILGLLCCTGVLVKKLALVGAVCSRERLRML